MRDCRPKSPLGTRAAALFAALFAVSPTAAWAGPNLSAVYAVPHYSVAASCDLTNLVSVNVTLQNRGDAPTPPIAIAVSDGRGMLGGGRVVSPVVPGQTISLGIPLHLIAGNAWDLGGVHPIAVSVGSQVLDTQNVAFPAVLCPPPATTPAPSSAGSGSISSRSTSPLRPKSPVSSAIGDRTTATSALKAALAIAAPVNLRSVTSGTDCGTHVGPIGALVCPDMMKSGDLLLIWDWPAGAGPIDGYRIYSGSGGTATQPAGSHAGKDQTLFDVPKPGGGFTGRCYAVSAYAGNRESRRSPVFCAGGGSVAKTIRLLPVHARTSHQEHNVGTNFSPDLQDDERSVGFGYRAEKRALGDNSFDYFYRSAWAFDVTPLANHTIFAAKLTLRIKTSDGAGNNHSCATDVGTGVQFWWLNQGWIDGRFGYNVAPTDVGPVVSADVTAIVTPWLHGEPNYGFVVKNGDENIRAFTNKTCLTVYGDPVLEVTYY